MALPCLEACRAGGPSLESVAIGGRVVVQTPGLCLCRAGNPDVTDPQAAAREAAQRPQKGA